MASTTRTPQETDGETKFDPNCHLPSIVSNVGAEPPLRLDSQRFQNLRCSLHSLGFDVFMKFHYMK